MSSDVESSQAADSYKQRRAVVILVFAALGTMFLGLQLALTLEEHSNSCTLTPPGYFDQELVSMERHLLSVSCTLDPHNGEPRYTIQRPWQSVRGL